MLSNKGRLPLPTKSSLSCSVGNREGCDSGESWARNYLLQRSLQGMRCDVPVAAAFSASHAWDRRGCSCPFGVCSTKEHKAAGTLSRHRASPRRPAWSSGHLWEVEMYCSARGTPRGTPGRCWGG